MCNQVPLLEVRGLSKKYKGNDRVVEALKPINFELQKGKILGVIGESGSGKSTLLKLLTALEQPTSGHAYLLGKKITGVSGRGSKHLYRHMQMVFQNPIASFNPRKKMRSSILENMRRLKPECSKNDCNMEIDRLIERVGLSTSLLERYPHSLSGGQCQRIAIARALTIQPKLLLCDEITSALDVVVQAQVIELIEELNKELGIGIVFVSHDLSLTCNLCDEIMVMHQGTCVENGQTNEILNNATKRYTQSLLAASRNQVERLVLDY